MPDFKFFCPIQVRYSDLDPQWHVNNVRYLAFLEEARVAYLQHLGLWDGRSFWDIGMIVGDIHIRYLAPVTLDQQIQVAIAVTHIGNKSLTFAYQISETQTGQMMATAESIQIAYDYHRSTSIAVPASWREKISAFEGKDFPQPVPPSI